MKNRCRRLEDVSIERIEVEQPMLESEIIPVAHMHMPRRGIINKRTVDTLKKIYTRPNRAETSDTYTTTFPALKFYKHLAGKVDSIRIHENYKTGPAYFVKNDYVGRGKTYTCLCLYKCPPNPRQIRGLSSVLPASALIEMAKNQKTKTRVTSYEQTLK